MPCDPTEVQAIAIATLGCCHSVIVCCPRDPTTDPIYNHCLFRTWTRHQVGRKLHGVQSCTNWNPREDNCLSNDRQFWLGWSTPAVAVPPIPGHSGGINPWTGEPTGEGAALGVLDGAVMARSQADIDNGRVNTPNTEDVSATTRQLFDLGSPSILDAFGQTSSAMFISDGTAVLANIQLSNTPATGPLLPNATPLPTGYDPGCAGMVGGVNGEFPISVTACKGYFRPYGNYSMTKWSVRELEGGVPLSTNCFEWVIELLECRTGVGQNWEYVEAQAVAIAPSMQQIITGCERSARIETVVWLGQKDTGCPNLAP